MTFQTAKQYMEQSKELEGVLLKNLSVIFKKIEDLQVALGDKVATLTKELDTSFKLLKSVIDRHHNSLDWVISVLVDMSKHGETPDDEVIEILTDEESQKE